MAEKSRRDYQGTLIQCAGCGRVIGADQVNTRKRCAICSPPHEDRPDDDEKEPATA